jgi:AcrR family transcriptional regulator
MEEKRPGHARGQRREAILDVAREVFSAEGYAAASMSHIASRLGGSKGTLYNYFRSKEELFEAHVQERCDCHVSAAFAQSTEGSDPLTVLTGLGERLLTALLTEDAVAFYSLIVSEAQRNPAVGQVFYESGPRNGTRRVADFLEKATAAGQIIAEDFIQAAEDYLSLLHGSLHFKRILNVVPNPSPDLIRAEARHVAEVFMRAYGPR